MDILTFDIMSIFAYLAALTASTVSLTYGILALIPSGPFITQNLTVGIMLIVLSVTGIMAMYRFNKWFTCMLYCRKSIIMY